MTFGGNFWWGLVWAALINAAVALVVGYPTLRTNRHAFVIVTLTFALLVTLIARDWVDLTRGPLGIPNLPPPTAFGYSFDTTAKFYWIAWAFAVAMLGFLYALCSSRIGRTLIAIKQNEPLVRAQGISPMPYKLASFAVSAAITGAAGGVYCFNLSIIDPLFLDFYYMQTFLIIVIIGGAGSFWGVVVSGIALSALPEALRFSADFRMIIYGVILVVADVRDAVGRRRLAARAPARPSSPIPARGAAMSAVLTVTDLRKSYAGVHALDGVSFAVEAGSITGLIGPNGSGKSTAIDCISGFQKLDSGKVVLAGADITGRPAHHIARAGLMRTFQTVRIYDRLSLRDNLAIAAQQFDPATWVDEFLRTRRYRDAVDAAEGRGRTLVELIGLQRYYEAETGILSYGQKKLVALAAALMPHPQDRACSTSRWPASTRAASARSRRRLPSSTGPARPS